MRGQVMEMLGFLALAIVVIAILILARLYLAGGYGRSIITISERHENEGFRSGVLSILSTTENKTGKPLSELMSYSASTGKTKIDFGGEVGEVNIAEELTWRFNAIYGKDKWYLKIPFPKDIVQIQIILIADTSASLCDDIRDIKTNLPRIIEDLISDGYHVSATLYMLPGGQECCGERSYKLNCRGVNFPETSFFHCVDLSRYRCQTPPKNEEDWGRGLSCAVEMGPLEGWKDKATKIGIIISDELPIGSEDKGGTENQKSLDIGIDSAKKRGLIVFPIKADTGKTCCPTCDNCDDSCKICMMWWDKDWKWSETYIFTKIQCETDNMLTEYMEKMATETGGKMFSLGESRRVSESIKQILSEIIEETDPELSAGNPNIPLKNVKAVNLKIPLSRGGNYTDVFVYQWS